MGAYALTGEHQDGTAAHFLEEMVCEGSDVEDNPLMKAERQKRRDAIGARYLQGHVPFIQSAQLKGPFDRKSGWVNPWRSKQPVQKGPPKRTAVKQRPSLADDPITVGLEKRQRHDSNASANSFGKRSEISNKDGKSRGPIKYVPTILTECPITSIDIVGNRQPAHPNLYGGIKQFVSSGLRTTMGSAKKDECGNSSQHAKAGTKRGADTSWLKGADIGKRSRSDFPDHTSPTPKTRTQDIIHSGRSFTNSPRFSYEQSQKQHDRPRSTTELSTPSDDTMALEPQSLPFQGSATRSRRDATVQVNSQHAITKVSQGRRRSRSPSSDSPTRNPFISRKGTMSKQTLRSESVHEMHSIDEDDLDPTVDMGRTASEQRYKGGSFDERLSSLGCKTLPPGFSSQAFEPSPIRTILRDKLDQQALHGLSQASQLALAAETTEPPTSMNPSGPTHDVAERRLPGLEYDEVALERKSTTSQMKEDCPYLSPRVEKCFNGDSPLPPGSFKYRRVKRKAPTLLQDKQDSHSANVILRRREALKTDPRQSIEKQGSTPVTAAMSIDSRDQGQIGCARQQPLIEPLTQEWPEDFSINERLENDDVKETSCQSVDTMPVIQPPMPILIPTMSPGMTEMDLIDPQSPSNDNSEATDGSHVNISNSDDSPLLCIQEMDESNAHCDISASKCAPLPKEPATERPNAKPIEHEEVRPPCEVINEVVDEEPDLEDVTLSQDPGSQMISKDFKPVVDEPASIQDIRPNIVGGLEEAEEFDSIPVETTPDKLIPADIDVGEGEDDISEYSEEVDLGSIPENINSICEENHVFEASPTPHVAQKGHLSNADLISAAEENGCQPVPQSPWAMEEAAPAPYRLKTNPLETADQFSMSQSKDAAALLLDIESGHTSGSSTRDARAPQTDKHCISRPISPVMPVITVDSDIIAPSPKRLSQRKSPVRHFISTQDPVSLSLTNPWTNNTQSPIKALQAVKPKKRVSFSQPPCGDSDGEEQPGPPRRLSRSRSRSRDVFGPLPPPEAETLTEGDDKFDWRLKTTRDIMTSSVSQERLMSETRETEKLPSSPGIDAMAEAFLAADANVPPRGETSKEEVSWNNEEAQAKNIIAGSWNFDNLTDDEEEEPEQTFTAPVAVMMAESQAVNPWDDDDDDNDDDDGLPPFLIAASGEVMFGDEDDDVLHDMSEILEGWDVDAELDRARRENKGAQAKELTARERMGNALRY